MAPGASGEVELRYEADNRATWPLGCWNAWVAAPLDPAEVERRLAAAPPAWHAPLRDHVRTVQAVRRHHAGRAAAKAYQTHLKDCKTSACPDCRRLAQAFLAAKDGIVSRETST